MDKKSIKELIEICKERKIKKYSGLKKKEIVALIQNNLSVILPLPDLVISQEITVHRLNYIGSKFQLLSWITNIMREKTSWATFENKRVADLFAGTGIVSHHFRLQKAILQSNDAELYSSIITHAFTRSVLNTVCENFIKEVKQELVDNKHRDTVGFITENYSPYNGCIRKFFTIENAKRIDYIRDRIEKIVLNNDDYKFILASLLLIY